MCIFCSFCSGSFALHKLTLQLPEFLKTSINFRISLAKDKQPERFIYFITYACLKNKKILIWGAFWRLYDLPLNQIR